MEKTPEPDYTYESLLQVMARHLYEQKEKRARQDIDAAIVRINKAGPDLFANPGLEGTSRRRRRGKNKKEKGSDTPVATPAGEGPQKLGWCWFYNNGLRGGKECINKDSQHLKQFPHNKVSDDVFTNTQPPRNSSRGNSPAYRSGSATPGAEGRGGGKGKGKGGGGKGGGRGGGGKKGGGKGGDAGPRQNSQSQKDLKKPGAFRMVDGKKTPYFCQKHLDGKCEKTAKECKFRHMSQGQIDREIQSLNTM